ncbi:MAG: CerR family C-terminal domain-containing protein [Proteobacteria bacterium]|nr:CerR family C-terminal domain-containing protein [Pseudomonadota bacterium]
MNPRSSVATTRPARAASPPADSARVDRRQAILLAAERLFSKHGYHAVSLRQIADEASVPLALVGYYFGPKNALFEAIFEQWNHTIEQRLAALAAVRIDPANAQTLPRIIEAFIAPVLQLRASSEGEYYALLVARELSHATEEADRVLRRYFDPLAVAFIDALQRALPHATRGQVAWCYQFALGALLHHLTDTRVERLSGGEDHAADPGAGTLLRNFIVAGLRGALPRPRTSSSPTKSKTRRQAS